MTILNSAADPSTDLRQQLTEAISRYEHAREECRRFALEREMAMCRMMTLADLIVVLDDDLRQ